MPGRMRTLLKQLTKRLHLTARAGASDQEIRQFEGKTKLLLPDTAKELYKTCNGLVLEEGILRFHSLDQMLKYPKWFFQATWGYLPIVDNNDSDPWCICCKSPLSPYIVQVRHDDDAEVKFRSFETFLAALASFLKKPWTSEGEPPDRWCLEWMLCDFDQPERTPDDVRRGKAVLQLKEQLPEEEQDDAKHFSHRLCGEVGEKSIALNYWQEKTENRPREVGEANAKDDATKLAQRKEADAEREFAIDHTGIIPA